MLHFKTVNARLDEIALIRHALGQCKLEQWAPYGTDALQHLQAAREHVEKLAELVRGEGYEDNKGQLWSQGHSKLERS